MTLSLSSCPPPSIRRCLQAMAAPSRLSTPTSRSWRSLRPACPLCPRAPPSTLWATGRPTGTRMADTSTTTAAPRRRPGNLHEPGTPAAGTPEEKTTAQERARRYRAFTAERVQPNTQHTIVKVLSRTKTSGKVGLSWNDLTSQKP